MSRGTVASRRLRNHIRPFCACHVEPWRVGNYRHLRVTRAGGRVKCLLPRERVPFHGRRLGRRQDGTSAGARLTVAVTRARRRRRRRLATHRGLRLTGRRRPRLSGRRVRLGRAVAVAGSHFAFRQFPARSSGGPASFPTPRPRRRDGVVVVVVLLCPVLHLERDRTFGQVDIHGHGAVRGRRLSWVAFAETSGSLEDGRRGAVHGHDLAVVVW